jgi:hypothetical protein
MANAATPEVVSDLDLLAKAENFDPEAGTPVADQIVKFVEAAYEAWLIDNDAWRSTPPLSNGASALNIVDESRRYGSKVRDVPVTVQIRGYANEAGEAINQRNLADYTGKVRVIYRVRDKVQSGRKPNLSPNLSK